MLPSSIRYVCVLLLNCNSLESLKRLRLRVSSWDPACNVLTLWLFWTERVSKLGHWFLAILLSVSCVYLMIDSRAVKTRRHCNTVVCRRWKGKDCSRPHNNLYWRTLLWCVRESALAHNLLQFGKVEIKGFDNHVPGIPSQPFSGFDSYLTL